MTRTFVYTERDLLADVDRSPGSGSGSRSRSRFDEAVQRAWRDRMDRGLFRYRLGPLPTRVLPGRLGFVAQLNVRRATEKRRAQEVLTVRQGFDPHQFHFNQVRPGELMFQMCRGGSSGPEGGSGGPEWGSSGPGGSSGSEGGSSGSGGPEGGSCGPGGSSGPEWGSNGPSGSEGGSSGSEGGSSGPEWGSNGPSGSEGGSSGSKGGSSGPSGSDGGSGRPEGGSSGSEGGSSGSGGPGAVAVIINVSPLEFGHCLLVPDPPLCLPQVLTRSAARTGMEAVLLSADPGFRVGFNSLGAFASVNHLHLHGYYLDHELRVETAPAQPFVPRKGCYRLPDFPGGFLFYAESGGVAEVARSVCEVTDFLAGADVAHNVFLTRGRPPRDPPGGGRSRGGVRVVVWPRRSCLGAKVSSAFNTALCELAGHLPFKNEADYQAATEESVRGVIQSHLFSEDELRALEERLLRHLTGSRDAERPIN